MEELQAYPALAEPPGEGSFASVAAALNLVLDDGVLSLFSTTTVFGAPSDITLAELALEAFFPFDETTASTLRAIAAARGIGPVDGCAASRLGIGHSIFADRVMSKEA